MNIDSFKSVIDEILSTETIEISQIPDIPLYMDQLTTFFDDKLKSSKRNDDDKILTKTMINNYTKSELLKSPIKKKYSKEHILSLIIIYHLKSVLSINDINKIFESFKDSKEPLYLNFLNIQKDNALEFYPEISKHIEKITESCPDEKTAVCSIILMLINQANTRKRLAEKLIDIYLLNDKEDIKKDKEDEKCSSLEEPICL